MRSLRSLGFLRPAKAILVPGMYFLGFSRYWTCQLLLLMDRGESAADWMSESGTLNLASRETPRYTRRSSALRSLALLTSKRVWPSQVTPLLTLAAV